MKILKVSMLPQFLKKYKYKICFESFFVILDSSSIIFFYLDKVMTAWLTNSDQMNFSLNKAIVIPEEGLGEHISVHTLILIY